MQVLDMQVQDPPAVTSMNKISIEELSKAAHKQLDNIIWIKVVGIGNAGVGKTCLVKTFCESKFNKTYHETVGVDYGFKLHNVKGVDVRVTFWDFGGSPSYLDVRKELYHQTQACFLVYDVTNTMSFNALDDWMKEFEMYGGKGALVTVVGNKTDLRSKRVSTLDAQSWAAKRNLRHYLTSAVTGEGVLKMFNDILETVLARPT